MSKYLYYIRRGNGQMLKCLDSDTIADAEVIALGAQLVFNEATPTFEIYRRERDENRNLGEEIFVFDTARIYDDK